MAEKEFLRTQLEAADYLGVSDRTIRRWIKDGGIQKYASGYSRHELEEYAILIRNGATKISPIETKQLCHKIELAIGELSNIKSRLQQLHH